MQETLRFLLFLNQFLTRWNTYTARIFDHFLISRVNRVEELPEEEYGCRLISG